MKFVKTYSFIVLIALISCRNEASFSGKADGANSSVITESNNQVLLPPEYVEWVNNKDNHLLKEKQIDDLNFSALFKPYDYIVCLEQRTSEIKADTLKKSVNEMKGMIYFDFKIAIENGQGELLKYKLNSVDDYTKRVEYFAFKMQHDIDLISGSDTIPCSLFHFERTYDIAPYSTFLLGFDAGSLAGKKDISLVYHDQVFGKGIIQFFYSREELANVPKLKTI